MEQSPSWGTTSHSGSQASPRCHVTTRYLLIFYCEELLDPAQPSSWRPPPT